MAVRVRAGMMEQRGNLFWGHGQVTSSAAVRAARSPHPVATLNPSSVIWFSSPVSPAGPAIARDRILCRLLNLEPASFKSVRPDFVCPPKKTMIGFHVIGFQVRMCAVLFEESLGLCFLSILASHNADLLRGLFASVFAAVVRCGEERSCFGTLELAAISLRCVAEAVSRPQGVPHLLLTPSAVPGHSSFGGVGCSERLVAGGWWGARSVLRIWVLGRAPAHQHA